MELGSPIDIRLLEIHRQRNRLSYIPILIIIFTSTYLQRQELTRLAGWWTPIAIIFSALLLRFINFEVFSRSWLTGQSLSKTLNHLSMVLEGIGWGCHVYVVHAAYGHASPNVSYVLLVVAAMYTGGTISQMANRVSYYSFIIPALLVTALPFLQGYMSTGKEGEILIYIAVFFIYNAINFRTTYTGLRKSIETELKAEYERSRFRRLIDLVPGYVLMFSREGVYVDANNAALRIIPDLLGKQIGFLDPVAMNFIIEFLASSKDREISERALTVSGLERYFLISMQKTEDEGAVAIAIPMDELINAKKELRAQEAKAMYSAKLASLGEMAAGIAHEINNPLTIIQGSATLVNRLIDQKPIDIESVKSLSARMVSTSERIAKIIKGMKAISRNAENDPKELVKLSQIITQCVDVSRQRFVTYDIELVVPDLALMSESVWGREVQLCQVLVNLLSNAIDAVRTLAVRRVEILVEKNADWVDILVSDSGPGVSKENQSRIMEPFFSTKKFGEGTGLGLSISKSIIQEHGGRLDYLADAKVSTFRVRLPSKS